MTAFFAPPAFILAARARAAALQLLLALVLSGVAWAGSAAEVVAPDVLVPNANLHSRGLPPIPAATAARIEPYTQFTPRAAVSWHPVRRELVVATRAGNTTQLHRVDRAGAPLVQLTRGADPVRRGRFLAQRPESLLFVRDTGGNEQTQLYRLDPGSADAVRLTDLQRRHFLAAMNHARDRVLVHSQDLDKTGRREDPTTTLTLLDPLHPERARTVATLPGTGWGDYQFSFDDRRIVMVNQVSANQTSVWVMDLATGEKREVLAGIVGDVRVASGEPVFTRDGKGLFLATDRDSEFQRLVHLDLATGRLTPFGVATPWDVDHLALSPDGRTVAVITNENGTGVLRLYDAATRREKARPALPRGTVAGALWHHNSRDLALNINSPRSPGDVWVLDVRAGKVARWTTTEVPGLDASTFQEPEPIAWKSFDASTITGFITRPPNGFARPRPVLIQIHGGPESQARPGFLGRGNYLLNAMGIALVEPNVRGSTGYGKTFLALDDGRKREDSVKDIGALLDWIATQPDLDATRVAVVGGSYGGYMSLAVAIRYADRIAGAADVVGIANFVTFLERTESYRRDLRRVEYGDERDPSMRAFLTEISPVTHADAIAKPLFVVHGKNDPRVPYTEAEQIVEAVAAKGVPVWYLLADNEGHGFARKANADFYFAALVRFLGKVLLDE
ncbi:MAG: prolyl oligopeptidase family serine peptidase [Casimicrobiaceae bacterium]